MIYVSFLYKYISILGVQAMGGTPFERSSTIVGGDFAAKIGQEAWLFRIR
jgi:hypothetical protein